VEPAIETVDLARSFRGRAALDGLTLEVAGGEVVALLGPNGAGKTTAVRLLDGVLRPDRGRCRVLGLDPARQGPVLRRRTGVVTERAGLDDRLTARENLSTVAAVRGLRGPAVGRRIEEVLERLGVAGRADEAVQGASTGQRKRIALARALLHQPDVLFLDEPTSGLDPAAGREVVALVASLAREQGAAVVLCTHVLAEAEQLAGRVAVLARGRLLAFGRPRELSAALWPGLGVDVDLGGPCPADVLADLGATPGVAGAVATPAGLRLRVEDPGSVPGVVAELVRRGRPVHAVVPRAASLEDVYFALQERAGAPVRTAAAAP
jgi:ABC-2 type transport system ATP-binding protein